MGAITHRGIKAISLENFRALNVDELSLKPITVLCGVNSAGKSSFLKSALLMKQIAGEANIRKEILPLKGNLVDLGTYYNLVKDHELYDPDTRDSNSITIRLSFPCRGLHSRLFYLHGAETVDFELCFGPGEDSPSAPPRFRYYKAAVRGGAEAGELATLTIIRDEILGYRAVGSGKKASGLNVKNFENAQKVLESFAKTAASSGKGGAVAYPFAYTEAEQLLLFYKDFCTKHVDNAERLRLWEEAFTSWVLADKSVSVQRMDEINIKWGRDYGYKLFEQTGDDSFLTNAGSFSKEYSLRGCPFTQGLQIDTTDWIGCGEYLEELVQIFQTEVSLRGELAEIRYLGPIREFPHRYQVYKDGDELTLGLRGENAPYIMSTRQKELLKKPWHVDDDAGSFWQDTDSTLGEEINYWATRMGIGEIQCTPNKDIYPGLVTAKVGRVTGTVKVESDLTDVGFGISQVFPVLVGGLEMPEGSTLFIEQPEVHLHPGMQGDLADFFIATALSGKQYVLETHSDHIINRLVRRIVEDGLESECIGLADLVQIYFVDRNEDGETVFISIEVDDYTGINWPEGFFDEADREQSQILTAIVEKQRRQ